MRIILLTCVLVLAVAGTGLAKPDCDSCDPCSAVEACADACARIFTVACIRVKYTPRCDWPSHLCAVPFVPCDRRICIDAPCHMPVTPFEPCGGWCVPEACHKPVVSLDPKDPCPVEIELTGDRSLIAAGCVEVCTCESGCACDS